MNKRRVINQCDVYGNTALHLAVTSNSSTILSILINEGLKRNVKNKFGELPVDLAESLGRDQAMIDALKFVEAPRDCDELMQESKVQEPSVTIKLEHYAFNDENRGRNQFKDSVTGEHPKSLNSVCVSVMDIKQEDDVKKRPELIKINVKQKI
eukprot:TRINITY_DN2522_c0_g1_i21.p1 TRINITY_DN2522_c0_g1~~TRINITY_DN2522_c0_g1_i21.p1  ORF type:complete len:153 (+),score=28.84 TRINITY_DN2522_c0_g1_i21:452-910(+)